MKSDEFWTKFILPPPPLHVSLGPCGCIYDHKKNQNKHSERSGLVVECLTQDRRTAGSSLTGSKLL